MKNILIKSVLIFIFVTFTSVGLNVARAERPLNSNRDLLTSDVKLHLQLNLLKAEGGLKTTHAGGGLANHEKTTNS
jgi:hypothetical protein